MLTKCPSNRYQQCQLCVLRRNSMGTWDLAVNQEQLIRNQETDKITMVSETK